MRPRGRAVHRFQDLPLFWKLLVPFATVLVVVGVFGAFVMVRDLSSRAQATLNENLLQASLEARALLQERELYLLESANLAANVQGMGQAVADQDTERVAELLRSVLALKTDLDAVVVTDPFGVGMIEFEPGRGGDTAPTAGGSWDRAPFVREVLSGDGRSKHAGFVDLGSRRALAIAAPICPVIADCVPAGAAIVALDAAEIARAAVGPIEVEGRGVALFGLDGQRLAGAGLARIEPLTTEPDGDGALRRTERIGDTEVYTAYSPLLIQGERRGTLAVSLPTQPLFASVRDAGLGLAALLLGALAAIVTIGALLSRMILRQVDSLVDTNRALGSGDLSARAPVLANDELGELARGLNQMAVQLQANYDTLELRVAQRTREVERLLRERTEFFASLSHELRTPLAVILSEADLVLDVDDEEATESGRVIKRSAAQLLAVVNDILDLAKADAGRFELDLVPSDLARVVDELRPTITGLAKAARIEPVIDLPDDLPLVSADPLRLREVVLNLVDNAVKYTPDEGSVVVRARAHGDVVEVAVEDSGPGIPDEVGDRVFEPFYRVKGVAALRGRSSSGLGLALSKGIIEAHGGTIAYESEPGVGTTFRFTVRCSQLEGSADTEASEQPDRAMDR